MGAAQTWLCYIYMVVAYTTGCCIQVVVQYMRLLHTHSCSRQVAVRYKRLLLTSGCCIHVVDACDCCIQVVFPKLPTSGCCMVVAGKWLLDTRG